MAVLGVMAIAATVGGVWVANVEPLDGGSTILGPKSVHVTTPSQRPHVTARRVDALGVSGMVLRIPVSPGMRFTYEVTIRNGGNVPVEIQDVGSEFAGEQVARHVVAAEPDHRGGALEDPQPFQPFTLQPGQEAGLVLEVRVADDPCVTEPGSIGWWWEPVTFRVFGLPWVERTQDVETGTEIALVGRGRGC
jgi:hypothetical protein